MISHDGPTSTAFTEDVKAKFEAYGLVTFLVSKMMIGSYLLQSHQTKAGTIKPSIIEVKDQSLVYGAEEQEHQLITVLQLVKMA